MTFLHWIGLGVWTLAGAMLFTLLMGRLLYRRRTSRARWAAVIAACGPLVWLVLASLWLWLLLPESAALEPEQAPTQTQDGKEGR